MAEYYEWFKAFHIISVIGWLSGMIILPMIYLYHTTIDKRSHANKIFIKLENIILRYLINPSMISTIVSGTINAHIYGFLALGTWFYIKMIAVILLSSIHGLYAKHRKAFLLSNNHHSELFYKALLIISIIPMTTAIFMVVLKPFE